MLLFALSRELSRTPASSRVWRSAYSTATKKSDPLRILFCGSDDFSCASLRALHDEQKRNAELIRSIDVVVRPGKRKGRGLKVLSEVPVRTLAEELGLPIHERDTFTGWDMPEPEGHHINLIIAVSFGLFVPPRLINASKYGGLNVHPSLLPDLRGPAPIHHALLRRSTHTGLTVQTLSPLTFDAGIPLAQTPRPGIPITPSLSSIAALTAHLASLGADMLLSVLRQGLHAPPNEPFPGYTPPAEGEELQHAPKITVWDSEVVWCKSAPGGSSIELRACVLGPLWAFGRRRDGREVRVILDGLREVQQENGVDNGTWTNPKWAGREPDGFVAWAQTSEPRLVGRGVTRVVAEKSVAGDGGVVLRLVDGSWLRVQSIKVEGSTFKPAASVFQKVLKMTKSTI
ncbi:Methionyl-tRNA formyltransferase [Staphylotrichum tortipilum]|uniref:methionyl-tRNA formyltransferase n=1 Tax=Staphylotrichum tortipilum TaxID=2831512 RepID=A0AAN6MP46_9PEZI|nr:Methionyl-tRNA formyltransferase [Staphylotrichum longicolle]